MNRVGPIVWLLGGVLAALAIAFAFPDTTAGGLAQLVVWGAIGVGVAGWWPEITKNLALAGRWTRWERWRAWTPMIAVALVGAYTFWSVPASTVNWPHGDWGPQHAVLAKVVAHMRHGELPHWVPYVSTGDPSLECYPAFTYVLMGALAIATGSTDLPWMMVTFATVVHVLICVLATRLATRLVPGPVAACVGILLLIDAGEVSSGGASGIIEWAIIHTAVALVFLLVAVVAVIDSLNRPKLRTSVAIWVFAALAAATHPVTLLAVAVIVLALVVVAVLARDIPARRALIAALHLLIGVGIAACVWLPLGERLLMYAQHFSFPLDDPARWFAAIARYPIPGGTFSIVSYMGYAGLLAALWTRRAVPVFVAACGILAILATSDGAYLALDLAPSQTIARIGAARLATVARPFVYLGAGYLAWLIYTHVRPVATLRRPSKIVAAFVGIAAIASARYVVKLGQFIAADDVARARTGSPTADTRPLELWAKIQMARLAPGEVARAYVSDVGHWYLHLTADTGLPTFHNGPTADVLLRERIEDVSPESFRRYNVKWIIVDAKNPSKELDLGDPATEMKVGGFLVRDIRGWDGKLARVEKGDSTSDVVVTRFEDDAIDVELRGTDKPALVALGMGYWPRWRATDASGDVPVYALPATPTGKLHVAGAWLRPGVTHFTCDGPLPSDGKGTLESIAAGLAALVIVVVWSQRRLRVRLLRAWARRPRPPANVIRGLCAAAGVVLVAWGYASSRSPVGALEVGHGARGTATIEVRHGNRWDECTYSTLLGEYHCGDDAIVEDTTSVIVNDEQYLWPFTTPAIHVRPLHHGKVEVNVKMRRRMGGVYWAGGLGNVVDLKIEGMDDMVTSKQLRFDVGDAAERDVEIHCKSVPYNGLWVTVVAESTLEPDRALPVAPESP